VATQSTFDRVGITYESLDHNEIRRRYPQIDVPEGTRAVFEENSGALLAESSVEAVVHAALEAGVQLETAKIDPLQRRTNYLEAVTTQDGEKLSAGLFVFACGSWLPKLFPNVLGGILAPTRQELFFFESPQSDPVFEAPALPIWIDGTDSRLPYGFPNLENAGVKLAFHRLGPPFDPDRGDRRITDEQVREAATYLYSRFPALCDAPLKATTVCHYENTANGDLLIDRHPSLENVWFVGGGSGHGFKHAPGVAEALLRAIDQGQMSEIRFTLTSKKIGKRVL
jgi:sarcosine oxidase